MRGEFAAITHKWVLAVDSPLISLLRRQLPPLGEAFLLPINLQLFHIFPAISPAFDSYCYIEQAHTKKPPISCQKPTYFLCGFSLVLCAPGGV